MLIGSCKFHHINLLCSKVLLFGCRFASLSIVSIDDKRYFVNILIDENMPYAESLFSKLGKVKAKVGREITADDLIDIDALMIRSVTKVDDKLLAKANRLKFVGSATAGIEHVDSNLLAQKDIFFTNAPGCNKIGVAEYVISVLMTLSSQLGFSLAQRKVGIVGAGNVGSYLANCLTALGMECLLCDPPKQEQDSSKKFHNLTTLLQECDVISLHTPMTKTTKYPTYHLIGENELNLLKEGCILINAARGEVVDNQALKTALTHRSLFAVLDVFEFEPQLDTALLSLLTFATPHIAGYGLEGKARGTTMIYNQFCQFIGNEKPEINIHQLLPKPAFSKIKLTNNIGFSDLKALCLFVYDIRIDDRAFRQAISASCNDLDTQRLTFDQFRKNYWDRREYNAITVAGKREFGLESLAQLGFSVERKL